MSTAPAIHFDDVSLKLGETNVVHNFTTTFEAAKWHCVLGKSGIGKSSLLRLMARLLTPDSGTVQVGEETSDTKRKISSQAALMAQDDGLLPWLTCLANIQLGPTLRAENSQQTVEYANELLHRVGLGGHANTLPAKLSGGMRQRVALARTLMEEKTLVLLDEPFSRLDAITRNELQSLAFELLEGKTVVMVTHDPAEAISLSHTVFVMEQSTQTRLQRIDLEGSPPRDQQSISALTATASLWTQLKETAIPDAKPSSGNV